MCSFSKFSGFISGMIAGPIYNNGANGSSSDTWPTAEMQGRSERICTYISLIAALSMALRL